MPIQRELKTISCTGQYLTTEVRMLTKKELLAYALVFAFVILPSFLIILISAWPKAPQ